MSQNALFASESWNLVANGYAESTMFGTLRAIKPNLPQPQRAIATLENMECFKKEMEEAGFHNVEIRQVTKAFPIPTIPVFWDFMVNGSASIQMMKKGMGVAEWREKEMIALAWLEQTLPTLKKPLTSDVWLGEGVK